MGLGIRDLGFGIRDRSLGFGVYVEVRNVEEIVDVDRLRALGGGGRV